MYLSITYLIERTARNDETHVQNVLRNYFFAFSTIEGNNKGNCFMGNLFTTNRTYCKNFQMVKIELSLIRAISPVTRQ